jgi:integrase
MPLTAKQVERLKAQDKLYRVADSKGLCLEVPPTGNKRWRFRYRFNGTAKMLSLGVWPDVNLAKARDKRDALREILADGIDPAMQNKAQAALQNGEGTFEAVALEWFDKFKPKWTDNTASRKMRRLEAHVFPLIGGIPIGEVDAPQVRRVLLRMQSLGKVHSGHRVRSLIGEVMRYAIAMGMATYNPCPDLIGVLPPAEVKHRAAVTDPKQIGALLRAIEDYQGNPATRCAMKLAALTFVRPGELRQAEWAEMDLGKKEWRIPAEKMKMKRPHIVPLCQQSIAVLKELKLLTGHGKYLFPSERTAKRPMSNNTVLSALRRMGYSKQEMSGHGFRSMASTNLNEMAFHPDHIERQLAHSENDKVRAAYNYAEYLPERKRMMQAWGDYLDQLRDGGKVIPIQVNKA